MKKIAGILLIGILLLNIGKAEAYDIKGNGKIKTEIRTLEPFNRVEINGAFKVFLSQGNESELRIVADDNLLEIIGSKVINGKLIIRTKENIKKYNKMELYITLKNLIDLTANGAIFLKTQKQLKLDDFNLVVNGASSADLDIWANRMKIRNAGASSIRLKGKTKDMDIDISGAGSANTLDLEANNVSIKISGVGTGKVYAKDKLMVSISGIGSVKYKGNPSVQSDVSLLGTLQKY